MNETSPSSGAVRKKFRKLRIAFSAACGIACLLLIALWVRSYWCFDQTVGPISTDGYLLCQSLRGKLLLEVVDDPNIVDLFIQEWSWTSLELDPDQATINLANDTGPSRFRVTVSDWSLVIITFALLLVPWLRWRFSLRTLLIGMTVVAAVLAAFVWAAR
ncbi:MAG: hypothetical protein L0228_15700 [Planctomycetes bacterium]|nr:hypothetical protein [Planctomycetota bacterium]